MRASPSSWTPRPSAGEPQIVQTADFATIDDAIQAAVVDRLSVQPRSAILAVAGPVNGDEIPLTNCPWVVGPKDMFATVGLGDVVVLNDFEAQALAVVALGDGHLEQIGGGEAEPDASRVVLGPGTGLGVAGLIHFQGKWIPVPGEGGHMDIGPRTPRDYEIFPHIERMEGRVSGEQILCGPRPGQHLPRRRDGRRRAAPVHAAGGDHRAPRSTGPMPSPRKRSISSSPAWAARRATWRWCSRAAAAFSSPAASRRRSCRR